MFKGSSKIFYGLAGSCFAASVFYKVNKEDPKEKLIEPNKSLKWNSNWDRRDPHSLIKLKKRSKKGEQIDVSDLTATARRHIFLIRHGQYNTKTEEMKLTSLGREQAELLGQRLKELNISLSFSKIIRSTLERAIETSDIVHKFLPEVPLETTELLNEGSPIPCEPPAGAFHFEYESFQDGPRIEAAFRKYFYRAPPEQKYDTCEIIVCHANVIRYFVCRLLQVPPEAWLRFSLDHCSITWTIIHPDGHVNVVSLGESGFLPPDKVSRRNC